MKIEGCTGTLMSMPSIEKDKEQLVVLMKELDECNLPGSKNFQTES